MSNPLILGPSFLESLVNHVALPQKIPGKQDSWIDKIEHELLDRLLDSTRTLRDLTEGDVSHRWERVRLIIQNCKASNAGNKLNKASLLTSFRNLDENDVLILHVNEQNAGLLIRRQYDDSSETVVFEAFEASPLPDAVLAAKSALQWDFPGCAVAIPYSEFKKNSFQYNLAVFLERASTESIKRFAARTQKAGSFAYESRGTVDPSLITQMLMTLLEANGRRVSPPLLRKRVRDDVVWTDGAQTPWRRCPYWLILRVGLEKHLRRVHGSEAGRVHYKFLICLLIARLIDDCLYRVGPELLVHLKGKLARRLSKLEVDRERAPGVLPAIYEAMFSVLGPLCLSTMKKANERIEAVWNEFKIRIRRPINLLPRYADQRHLYLTLPLCGPYLQKVLSSQQHTGNAFGSSALYRAPVTIDVSKITATRVRTFSNCYFSLSESEAENEWIRKFDMSKIQDYEGCCIGLASEIDRYLSEVKDSYNSNPEQNSFMLLTVMNLWMNMDKCATKLFDLLFDFSPAFPADVLNPLQLPHFKDMSRLQDIEEYLQSRHKMCNFSPRTIFDDPGKGCFAERYFDDSKDRNKLQQLRFNIETEADSDRLKKEEEWRSLTAEFETLEIAAGRACTSETNKWGVTYHNHRTCGKCLAQKQAKSMRIKIHEHPLPSNLVQAKTVVFELGCPDAFSIYRTTTWRILGSLARAKHVAPHSSFVLQLCDYSELKPFMTGVSKTVSIASTIKSHLITHYSHVPFPATRDDVFRPNGLRYAYYDTATKVWPGLQSRKFTFTHHCQMPIPPDSPFSSLQLCTDLALDSSGPSSNEIIASLTKCPPGLNVHEYMAFQALLFGKHQRWPSLLSELGSSNLNFSTDAACVLVTRLVLEAGPPHKDDPLRAIHRIFRDKAFCRALLEQLGHRLETISSNWRETKCMDTLLTLILRLWSIGSKSVIGEALKLIEKARSATTEWTRILRKEVRMSTDAETSRKASRYAFWAALLCRRTLLASAEGREGEGVNMEGLKTDGRTLLEPEALHCFIESSIILQEMMVDDPFKLLPMAKNALIRDLKMVHQMRFVLRRSLEAHPQGLESAINKVWPQPESTGKRFSELTFLDHPNDWWVQLTVRTTYQTMRQTIHYHLLEGHLLVDGQPLGKLPAQYRDSVVLEQLFGKQSLLTFPSGLPGMKYVVAVVINGHQIHLGFRNNALVVRALVDNRVLELIPREVFGTPADFDLPAALVENCVHWLDLRTGVMEIRRFPDIWISRPGNWSLNLTTRMARRRDRTSLLDPRSTIFKRLGSTFDFFEHRWRLTAFQPDNGRLSVELNRLELSFFVNPRKLLQCKQLRAEVDPNQDIGALHGLRSHLVMRDMANPQQRSIVVPLGPIIYRRNGCHVNLDVKNEGIYGRFAINEVLGRLDCPNEPRLLHMKARLHAYTSFPVPDRLTGRTGAEEALHCLKSGNCQPWQPLSTILLKGLTSISNLTPRREYYPKDMKKMQRVCWDPQLTTAIQHDAYFEVVREIYETSRKLSSFALEKEALPSLESRGDSHLLYRSSIRRRLYQRPHPNIPENVAPDSVYDARDRRQSSAACNNVFGNVTLIRNWPSEMCTTKDLAGILQTWPVIGGYDRTFDKVLLSDCLDVALDCEWGALVSLCRVLGKGDVYPLMFLFGAMSFRSDVSLETLRTLLAYAMFEDLKTLEPPAWPIYTQFRQNRAPSVEYLVQLIKSCSVPYAGDPWSGDTNNALQFNLSFRHRRNLEAAEQAHDEQAMKDCTTFAQLLLKQWPCPQPSIEGLSTERAPLIDVHRALRLVIPEWLRLFQNMELQRYTEQVQRVLDGHFTDRASEVPAFHLDDADLLSTRCRGGEIPSLSRNLLRKTVSVEPIDGPLSPAASNQQTRRIKGDEATGTHHPLQKENISNGLQRTLAVRPTKPPVSHDILELETIIAGIANSKSTVRLQYGRDLKQSLSAFKLLKNAPKPIQEPILLCNLSAEISKSRKVIGQRFIQLSQAFERNDSRARWLKEGGLWPCVTTVALLEQLRSTSDLVFGKGMKEGLVAYAVSITALQRLLRIEDSQLTGNEQKSLEEQQNTGHSNWHPLHHPDWLLLEIDANILIRRDQVNVATATISPASGSNSVLQMNMGQGKTSCIMPMVATVIADKLRLARIIVPKALLLQTAQLLQGRIGGLLGRRVMHIPFSRKTPTERDVIRLFLDMHKEILASSGVVVALPEHIMSFQLSGIQRLSDARIPEATTMINIQSFLAQKSRDVLDECDFTLAVKTQLIYPSGSQTTVDGHPHRWEVAEVMLRLVEGHLWNLQKDFPQSIEVVRRPQGGFPLVYFLRGDVEEALVTRLVGDILRGQTSLIPGDCTKSDRQAIKHFISDPVVRPQIVERVSQLFPDNPAVQQKLYLVRGLLMHRILLLTLKKRWNVEYGMNPNRDPIAVPFHAKGVPSDQAEWGHPDVSILFTTLSFYFGGLNPAQLRQSLEHVMKSDDPSCEYDRWTQSSKTLPDSLREWSVINVDDESQLAEVWQHIRYSVVVIDHFLNNFVFPKHAKQFRMKLQASGWDIPLPGLPPGIQPSVVRPNDHLSLTTGFSGTNDNRTMMPLTIKQEDLPTLSHTNAEVLTYLLQPRNRTFVLAADRGRHISEPDLLHMLKRRGIRVLIDAGAQILEMDNYILAKTWLKVDTQAPAAVYFNDRNKPFVLYRTGLNIPLSASPFLDNLGDCLVYLDEAHTRGTDLKMPVDAVGALTLGLGQTKDHTVQAAMRLRQLATSQSIVFFAPPEVHQSILDVRKKKHFEKVDSGDVVCWLLEQTCNGIEQLQPLYYAQGNDFCHRMQAALNNPHFLSDSNQRDAYLSAVRQNEQQSLQQLYQPKDASRRARILTPFSAQTAALMKQLNTLRRGFQDNGNAVHGSALQEVEQEREVAFEVETVREAQKPVHHSPLSFPGLHRDVEIFVSTGRLAAGYIGYEHAFEALRRTSLGRKYGINSESITSKLFVSREFSRTVKIAQVRPNDNYLRDVHWIVWSGVTETALIIVPEEAEIVSPLIRDNKNIPTHLLTYAAPVTRRMLHFNNLSYYAVPPLPIGWAPPTRLTIELGIFAGRLYFEFKEYSDLRRYLGFREEENATKLVEGISNEIVPYTESHGLHGAADEEDYGDEIPNTTEQRARSFTAQPLIFLQKWLAVRRKGQDFSQTPMGYVCQGKPLTADHAFFSKTETEAATESPTKTTKVTGLGLGAAKDVGDADSDQDFDSEDAFFDCAEGQSALYEDDAGHDDLLSSEEESSSDKEEASEDEAYSDAPY